MDRATRVVIPSSMGELGLLVMDGPTGRRATLPMLRGGGLSMTLEGAGMVLRVYHWTAAQWAATAEADRPGGAKACRCCPDGGWCYHEAEPGPAG